MKKETFICDIKDCKHEAIHIDVTLQVIFTTDQTEGRSVDPYLSIGSIDLCDECMYKILQGNYVYGCGAQGYNEYKFKNQLL